MVMAIGYSVDDIDPHDPGRLCRGRERWIEPFEADEPAPRVQRVVISGAVFSDDSASDARRGLPHAAADLAHLIAALFPRRTLLAFAEDGHPADIPEGAEDVEMYEGHRAGGRGEELMVRWSRKVDGIRELREVIGHDDEARVLGFAWMLPDADDEDEVRQRVFLLTGMSSLDSPPARFQPAALPELLELARAVILLHRDKHGPALGIYSLEPLGIVEKLENYCAKEGLLAVPFAIPPMLARWDRALAEARQHWIATRDDEFPVPVAPEQSRWEPRWARRRNDRHAMSAEAEQAAAAARGEDVDGDDEGGEE